MKQEDVEVLQNLYRRVEHLFLGDSVVRKVHGHDPNAMRSELQREFAQAIGKLERPRSEVNYETKV